MTRTVSFVHVPLLAVGLVVALCSAARCDDVSDASRESIIQNVREDVRRHIRAQQAQDAGKPSRRMELSQDVTPRRVAKKRNRTMTE